MSKKGTKWTEQEDDELRKLAERCTVKEIALKLERPLYGVKERAKKLKIVIKPKSRQKPFKIGDAVTAMDVYGVYHSGVVSALYTNTFVLDVGYDRVLCRYKDEKTRRELVELVCNKYKMTQGALSTEIAGHYQVLINFKNGKYNQLEYVLNYLYKHDKSQKSLDEARKMYQELIEKAV